MNFQPSRFGIPLDQIVRPSRSMASPVPAGVPLDPDARILSWIKVILQTETSGALFLAVYGRDASATLPEGQRLQSHEDLFRLGLRWNDARFFGPSAMRISTHDENTLRNHLIKEYAITIHSIGAKAAWQGTTPGDVLQGLVQMAHAIEEMGSVKPRQPTLLSPMELIRTAPWGRLLATGFDQPAIGRWHPSGGLIYCDIGSAWKALGPVG